MGYYRYEYVFDNQHGFGLVFYDKKTCSERQAFYEDETILPAEESSERYAINCLTDLANENWHRYTARERITLDALTKEAGCRFTKNKAGMLRAVLERDQDRFEIKLEKDRYFYAAKCSCQKKDCIHAKAAGMLLNERLERLLHTYITTDQPVEKGRFLEPVLEKAIRELPQGKINEGMVACIRGIIYMLEYAKADDYWLCFHENLLELEPPFYEYDAHFLEKHYDYLLLALFEEPGYSRVVIDSGVYADAYTYSESRQRRSNRACFKRILKEYKKVVKEMDVKGDYASDTYKELLLKYREDYAALLHYYAAGKEELDESDLPYLEKIASLPAMDQDYAASAAVKLDAWIGTAHISKEEKEEAGRVFHLLADRLSPDKKIDLYSNLGSMTMTLEEIRSFPYEEQRKLAGNMPLTRESIAYAFDHLLSESTDSEKGRYLLQMVNRTSESTPLNAKKTLVVKASTLPDNRLLLAYVVSRTRDKGEYAYMDGDPEKELTTYFECIYEIEKNEDSYRTVFSVEDPASGRTLLSTCDEEGRFRPAQPWFLNVSYDAGLVRKVCLAGKEEEYRKESEACREEVEASIFGKQNKKFFGAYQKFCASLTEEKLIFAEDAKAEIEWYFYREEGSNALAFRVGHRKKYVVKDAPEFIGAFKSGRTIAYGKDLTLTHDPDNLNETDAVAMRMLLSAKYTRGRKSEKTNKRYITVGDSLIGNLLELLTGRLVWWNETQVSVRLAPVKVRLKVDKKYALTTSLDKQQDFIDLDGKGYIINRGTGGQQPVIDRMAGSVEEVSLIDLVYKNPSVRIRPILPDFKKNIYQRYFDMIDVDPSVRKDFELSQLRFHTYFDLEKASVTAKIKIIRGEKEIEESDLTVRMDRAKHELLTNYLSGLGFTDGVMEDESHILNFFKMDFTKLKKLTHVYLSESLKNKELKTVGKPVIRVSYSNNIVSVFMEKSEYDEADMEKIIAALRRKKKYILLSGDRIVDLDNDAAKDLGDAVKDFGMDPKDLYHKKTISMVTAIKAFSHERSCSIDKYLRDMIGEIRSFKDADIALPKLAGELRDYQKEGYQWLSVLAKYNMGGILADDMGLGKTLQIIALIKADKERKPSLVVCPKSLVFNWLSEFARFDPDTKVSAIYGSEAQRRDEIASIDYQKKAVYVTSYDSLRNDIEKYTGKFNYAILDEAQYIKNIHALKTKSVKEIKAQHRFALTGTPIENSVIDLWSIFDFIMPGYFEDLPAFKGSETADIARKAGPFILRRVKEDVLEDLPSKYERILSADMSEAQRRIYEAMRQEAREQLETGGKAFDILPYLTRLRQVCVNPAMFLDDYAGGSGKMDLLKELIREYLDNHHRLLIFSQFVKALEETGRMLEEMDIPYYFLSGATAAKDRMQMVDSYNNGSGTDVFLISLKAGGTGLNLTGADTVIHLDPWWNVAAENQASDRTHRIGQTRNVEVIKLIAENSIEQKVIELQNIKKEVIHQVISDNDGSVTSANLEDIAFVLG